MNKFGEKVKVKQFSFMIDEDKKILHTGYYPMIEVNGNWAFISDDCFMTDMVNMDTRYKAKKLGEELLERLRKDDCQEALN